MDITNPQKKKHTHTHSSKVSITEYTPVSCPAPTTGGKERLLILVGYQCISQNQGERPVIDIPPCGESLLQLTTIPAHHWELPKI